MMDERTFWFYSYFMLYSILDFFILTALFPTYEFISETQADLCFRCLHMPEDVFPWCGPFDL